MVIGLLFGFIGANSLNVAEASIEEVMAKVYQAAALQNTAPDSALSLGRNVVKESQGIAYAQGVAYGYMRIGSIFHLKGNSDSALYYVKKASTIRKNLKDDGGAASANSLMGYIFIKEGHLDSAMASFYQAMHLLEKGKDTSALIETLLDIGHLYGDQYGYKEAKSFYDKAFSLAEASNDILSKAYVHEAYGKYYWHKESYDSALTNYSQAADLFVTIGDNGSLPRIKNNIALCYDQLGNNALAISFFQEALEAYTRLNFKHEMATTHYNIGLNYKNIHELDSSLLQLRKAKEIALKIRARKRLAKVYAKLAAVFNMQQEKDSAYSYQLLYTQLRDTLLNEEQIASMAKMRTQFEAEQKEKDIQLLRAQNENKAAQRSVLILAVCVLILTLFILLFLYQRRKKLAKENEHIAQQKISSLLDEQEKKTYNAMLKGQEEERTRIASDLHDRLGGMLSTVKLLFSSLNKKLDRVQIENKQQYERASSLLDEACIEVRRISHNLGAGMVSKFGLMKALDELCDSIDQSGSISCQLSSYGMEDSTLSLNMEVGIYRMVQEIFHNTLKYAKASHIQLQINQAESIFTVMVEDNGVGFDSQNIKKNNGMGFKNLKTRAQNLSGSVHIDSSINRGCTIIIELPIPDKS